MYTPYQRRAQMHDKQIGAGLECRNQITNCIGLKLLFIFTI